MQYTTTIKFTDHETKSAYVYDKYRPLLKGSVLDVDTDCQYLKPFVGQAEGTYHGVGFGGQVDQQINFGAGLLSFDEHSFDTVLCLDVSECRVE